MHVASPAPTTGVSLPRTRRSRLTQGLLALAVVLSGWAGAGVWQLSHVGPSYRFLDDRAWQAATTTDAATLQAHPRRDMAYAAQDWLEGTRPARFQVLNRLGTADAVLEPGTEAYRVGCGFTVTTCEQEDWLLVRYGEDMRVEQTYFQPAVGLPSSLVASLTPH